MLVKVTPQNVQGRLLAQNMTTYECICEVDQAPECEHEVAGDIPAGFMQLLYPGTFGKYLSIDTIRQIESLEESLTEEEFGEIGNIKELRLMARLNQAEERADEQDLLLFELITNGGV